LACQYELFVDNPLKAKENDEHALDFALRLSSFIFSFSLSLDFPLRLILSSPIACIIIARVSALFLRFVQNLMLLLCRIQHNRIEPDTALKIKGYKK
jgi:hypothetical protein